MREGIHPNYYQATVTCNCGNTLLQVPPRKRSTWKFAPNAIPSTRDSRKQRRLADVLISSTRNTALNKNDDMRGLLEPCFFSLYD